MWAGQKVGRDLHCALTNSLMSLHSTGLDQMHQGKAHKAGSSCYGMFSQADVYYLILCELSTACACLAMPIKYPKEHLLRIAPKTPVYTDRVLQ